MGETPTAHRARTLVISLAFKWYVSHFADYQKTYGAIGGVMIALLWFYFTSLAILLGAQMDATIAQASSGGQSATDGVYADRRQAGRRAASR